MIRELLHHLLHSCFANYGFPLIKCMIGCMYGPRGCHDTRLPNHWRLDIKLGSIWHFGAITGLGWGLGTNLALDWGLGTKLALGWCLGTNLALGWHLGNKLALGQRLGANLALCWCLGAIPCVILHSQLPDVITLSSELRFTQTWSCWKDL